MAHTAYRGVVKTPYIIRSVLSCGPIVGKTLPLPNNDVDSATENNKQTVIINTRFISNHQ